MYEMLETTHKELEKTSRDDCSTCRLTRYVCVLIDAARNALRNRLARHAASLHLPAIRRSRHGVNINLSAASLSHATHPQ